MKIAIDIRCLAEGRHSGVEEYTTQLLRALFSMDPFNEYVLFLNSFSEVKTNLAWVEMYSNVSVRRFRIPNKLLNLSLWYLRRPFLDKLVGGADIFFFPNINFLSVSPRAKCVLTMHDLSFVLYPETFSVKRRLWHAFVAPKNLCRRADRLIAVSQSTMDDIATHYGISQEKISLVPSGVSGRFSEIDRNDPRMLHTKTKYGLPYRFAFFLGTREPRKNIGAVIAGYEKYRDMLSEEETPLHLVIAGTSGWGSGAFLAAAHASRYQNDIHCIGCVDDEDKPVLYNLAEVFVYLSLYEGFGFPVLEAMRCGTPTITAHHSSLAEITDGYALLIDPYKPNELALALREFSRDKRLGKYGTESGRRRAYEYRWELTASATLEVFRETLGGFQR